MNNYFSILSSLLLVLTSHINSQQANVETISPTHSVQVAEPLTVQIIVTAPSNSDVKFPGIETSIGQFDVVDYDDRFGIPAESTPNESTWIRSIVLESIETGDLVFPEQKIEVRSNGKLNLLTSDRKVVRVESVLENRPDPMKFRDIKGVVDVSVSELRPSNSIGWIVGGTMAFSAVALSLFLLVTRKKWIQPATWAISELRSLSSNNRDADSCFSEIVRIVRQYLDTRFGLDRNLAKRDLLSAFRSLSDFEDGSTCLEFESLLDEAESAKFAGRSTGTVDLNNAINRAIHFVGQCEKLAAANIKSGAA